MASISSATIQSYSPAGTKWFVLSAVLHSLYHLIAVGFTQNDTIRILLTSGHEHSRCDTSISFLCDNQPSDCCPRTLAVGNTTLYEEGVRTYGNITDDVILVCPYPQAPSKLNDTAEYCKYDHVGATFRPCHCVAHVLRS